MATRKRWSGADLSSKLEQAAAQFRDLNTAEPGRWPPLPRFAAFLVVLAVVVLLGWLLVLQTASEELETERNKEPALRNEYRSKLAQSINLSELQRQKLQIQEYVTQLEKQLPGKAEMDQLLSDINQAGLGRGLQFELFRPGTVVVKDYYAELPIAIRVTGRYHDIGSFTADVANLSRIVTLHNLVIGAGQAPGSPAAAATAGTGPLSMEATARTYRYLDPAEVAEQKAAAAKAAQGARR